MSLSMQQASIILVAFFSFFFFFCFLSSHLLKSVESAENKVAARTSPIIVGDRTWWFSRQDAKLYEGGGSVR